MKDDEKMFLRTLCIVSATMASISFVGVSIILSIYFNLPTGTEEIIKKEWLQAANIGVVSVFLFSFTTFCILVAMFPKDGGGKRKRSKRIYILTKRVETKLSTWVKENVLGILLGFFMMSWISFFSVVLTLFFAFNV